MDGAPCHAAHEPVVGVDRNVARVGVVLAPRQNPPRMSTFSMTISSDQMYSINTYPTTVGKPCRPKSDQTGATTTTTTSRACCTCCTFRFLKCVAPDARPTSGRAASGSGGTGGTSLRGKRHDLQDRQRRPRPVGRQLLVGDASSLRAATPSCGFSRSSTHRAPWGVAPATPRTNWCVSCAAALSSPSSSSSLWALTKLALSCGFSRSSTHPAPWGVAPATPRTNRCVCCAAAQSCPSDGH